MAQADPKLLQVADDLAAICELEPHAQGEQWRIRRELDAMFDRLVSAVSVFWLDARGDVIETARAASIEIRVKGKKPPKGESQQWLTLASVVALGSGSALVGPPIALVAGATVEVTAKLGFTKRAERLLLVLHGSADVPMSIAIERRGQEQETAT